VRNTNKATKATAHTVTGDSGAPVIMQPASTQQTNAASASDSNSGKSSAKQLPARLISSILEYVEMKDYVAAQRVSRGWKLDENLVSRVWRKRYLHDFEAETSEAKEIAVDGKETSWLVRYKHRWLDAKAERQQQQNQFDSYYQLDCCGCGPRQASSPTDLKTSQADWARMDRIESNLDKMKRAVREMRQIVDALISVARG
jgi:hypothetical protein